MRTSGRIPPILASIFLTSATSNPEGDAVSSLFWVASKNCRYGLYARTGTPALLMCELFDFATITPNCCAQ